MQRVIIILSLWLVCASPSCWGSAAATPSSDANGSAQQVTDYQSYVEKVESVDHEAGAVFSADAFLSFDSFSELSGSASQNIDFCIRFLSDNGHTPQQRLIAILSMYKLGVDEYVVFVRKLVELRNGALVSSRELEQALLPRLSNMVLENYQSKEIQSLLSEIEVRNEVRSSIKATIRGVLSGEALEKQRRFDQECCSAPK